MARVIPKRRKAAHPMTLREVLMRICFCSFHKVRVSSEIKEDDVRFEQIVLMFATANRAIVPTFSGRW